jgi:hypothetical protein
VPRVTRRQSTPVSMTSVLSGNDQPLSLIFLLKGLVEYLISSRIDPPGVANIADTDEDGYPAMNEPYVTPLTKSGFFSALDDLPPPTSFANSRLCFVWHWRGLHELPHAFAVQNRPYSALVAVGVWRRSC